MMLNDACDKLRSALKGRAAVWAAVLAVAVSLVLGGAGGLGLARAFAATGSGYTITINEATSGSYSAYLLFTGSYDEDGNFGDVAFNDAVRDAVLAALGSVTGNTYTVSTSTSTDTDGTTTTTTTYSITKSSTTTTYTATTFVNAVIDDIAALSKADAQTFANTLAVALTATTTTTNEDGSTTTTNIYTAAATTTFTVSEKSTSATLSVSAIGYYLVVQTSATESDDAVTSAILMPVTGSSSVDQATAKVSTPTLDKEVADTSTTSGNWDSDYTTTDVADQGVTSTTTESTDTDGTTTSTTTYDLVTSISYRLTGTVASNIAEYSTYYYAFVDLLPEGILLTDENGTASTARVTNSTDNTVWTVTFYLVTTTTDDDGNEVESLEKITLSSDLTSDPFTVSVETVNTGTESDPVYQSQITWACTDLIAALKGATYGGSNTTLTTSDYANVQIVLEYSIDLTSDEIDALYASAWTLDDPLVNSAKVVFSNSPYATSTGETPEDTTQVYSYNLVINKIGEATNATSTYWATTTTTNSDGTTSTTTTLVYAKTTTTTTTDEETGEETSTTTTTYYTDSDCTKPYTTEEGSTTTYTPIVTGAAFTLTYVGEDGNTVTAGKDITANDNGTFTFTGLEAGVTYTITETTTPDGYKSIDPITFTITATKDETGEYVTSISVTENSDPSNAATLSVSGATVTATITNVKGPDIPFTGSTGIVLGLVIGGAIIAISLVAMVRNRKREQG